MTTQTAGGSDFIKQLGRMYGTYTGGFIGVHHSARDS